MGMFNAKKRKSILDTMLATEGSMTLGLYDISGVRRYWLPLPEVHVTDGKFIIAGIPPLVVDDTFTLGWLQIDNTRKQEMLRIELKPTQRTLAPGETLCLGNVTLSID